MVGRLPLKQVMQVRALSPQPFHDLPAEGEVVEPRACEARHERVRVPPAGPETSEEDVDGSSTAVSKVVGSFGVGFESSLFRRKLN